MPETIGVDPEALRADVRGRVRARQLARTEIPASLAAAVVDVRQDAEWASGHLPDAVHVELGALAGATLPDAPMTVMCGHGERAMTGASLLEAAGHRDLSVLIGGPDDWHNATGIDLQTT